MHIERILYDTHMHTPMCLHADGEPEEYAAAAYARGLKGIVITGHFPFPKNWNPLRMNEDQLPAYVARVGRARDAWRNRLDVRLGLECDYWPGLESWIGGQLARIPDLDYVLGSVHPIPRYIERFWTGDVLANQRLYFEHARMAAETGLFDTVAHLDMVKIMTRKNWDQTRLMDAIRQTLDRIAATRMAMEVSTAGLRTGMKELYPSTEILREAKARDIPLVLASDAHKPEHVAFKFEETLDLLQDVGYTHTAVCLNRKRHAVPIALARRSLRATASG
ncbi:MAG: histidinol-phosphatase HisJ family protein [Kiritimatiellae bacterium]|nr:histidinol-phosphatase HisJ family protein [Kiritimatiellia bacterium]